MIVPYLPLNKTIVSNNGRFIIKEVEDGYELWDSEVNHWLITCSNVNDFRETIGKVIKIIN